ncbi:MAG: hypothetical protein DRQ58_05115 [Gammaproteobacteria bacterium]|nr:MAG: hypothetical protein DRQ58_05115 [Gammaproteobacteria bacterium]
MIQQLIPISYIFIIAYAPVGLAEQSPDLDPYNEKLKHQLHRAILASSEDYLPGTRHLSSVRRRGWSISSFQSPEEPAHRAVM